VIAAGPKAAGRPRHPWEYDMNRTKTVARVAVGAAATAVALLGLGSPAHAVTSNGCTVNAITPYANGDIASDGDKLVNYEITVSCVAAGTVTLYDERWEDDPNQVDDLIGTSTIVHVFSSAGATTKTVTAHLPNTDDGWDQKEEMYHRVRFTVTSGVVTSPLSLWDYSGIQQIQV
jgi:hypothetical protein